MTEITFILNDRLMELSKEKDSKERKELAKQCKVLANKTDSDVIKALAQHLPNKDCLKRLIELTETNQEQV